MYFTNSLLETPLRYKKKSSFTSLHLLTKVANANQHYNARMVISPTVSILKWPKNFQPCACRGKTSPKGIVIKVEDNLSALDLCFKMELARGFFFNVQINCTTSSQEIRHHEGSNSARQGAKTVENISSGTRTHNNVFAFFEKKKFISHMVPRKFLNMA